MELIQKEDLRELLHELWRVSLDINRIKELYRPILDGEHLMSSEEVCDALKITKRTLQQYRDDGMLSYVVCLVRCYIRSLIYWLCCNAIISQHISITKRKNHYLWARKIRPFESSVKR